MAYIGNTPADKFLTLAKQNFSTSATTSYTLDSAVSSTQDIGLFINNVRQSPVDAYTVSGTALTLTSATAGTDEMYCVYLGKTVGTTTDPNAISLATSTNNQVVTVTGTKAITGETNFIYNGTIVGAGSDGANADLGVGLHVKTADSSGGVSADADELVLENSGHSGVTIASGNSSNGNIYFSDSGNAAIGYIQYGHDNNDLVFATNDAERMIILNDGHIAINGTSKLGTYSTGILSVTADIGNTDQGITIKNTNAAYNAEHMFMEFLNSSGARAGCISHTAATTTAYTTSSDYRLKENETNITDGINRLKQLKPYKFNFKADKDTTVDGFFAHEVSSIVPEAIIGKKDAVNKDNNPIYQGIDQSKLVPLLTSALQEAITKIETLETENTDIKARLTALENK